MMEVDPLKLETFYSSYPMFATNLTTSGEHKVTISRKLKNTQFKPFEHKFIVSCILQRPILNFFKKMSSISEFHIKKPINT